MSQQSPRRRRRRRPARPAGESGESEVGRIASGEAAADTSDRGRGGGKRSATSSGASPEPRRTLFGMPRMSVALLAGLLVAMIAVFAMQLIFPPPEVQEVEGVQVFPDQGRRHLEEGETFSAYNSSPPTSGPQPADAPVADVYLPTDEGIPTPVELLALLERGGVVLYYDPDEYSDADDPGGLLGAMQSLSQFRDRLAVVPFDGLTEQHGGATILAAAWKTLLAVDRWDADGNDEITAFLQSAPDGYYDRYRLERGDAALSAGATSE